jgi:hypothetical protein
MQQTQASGREILTTRYSWTVRVLAIGLILAAAAWDCTADIPALQNASALFCRRLAHHTRLALAGEKCCPLAPASLPAQKNCCEAPAPSQDAIPAAKQSGDCTAPCCMRVDALAIPPRTTYMPLLSHRGICYEREVLDLKMDMRI